MEMLACTGVYLYFAPMRSTLHECLKRWGKFGCGDVYVSPGPMDVYEGCIASSWDTGVWGALPLMRSTMSWDTGVWGALPLMRSTINECLEVGWGKCGCGDICIPGPHGNHYCHTHATTCLYGTVHAVASQIRIILKCQRILSFCICVIMAGSFNSCPSDL